MITPSFVRPSNVVGSDAANDPAFWNSKLTPVYDFVESVADSSTLVVTGDHTVTDESVLLVDCSGGDITITLPATRTQALTITKLDETFNEIILTSSAFIERAGDFVVNPPETTAKIVVPKQSITYLLVSGRYRIIDAFLPRVESLVRLSTTLTNLPVGDDNVVTYTEKAYDPFNLYTIATSRFTAPASGVYEIEVKTATNQLTATSTANGLLVETIARVFDGTTLVSTEQVDSAFGVNNLGTRSGVGNATVTATKGNNIRITSKVFGATQSVFALSGLSRAKLTLLRYEH